jgi:hypothetical protein
MSKNSVSRLGRPRKLASLRVYMSASSKEECEFIKGLERRKEADINFNIGSHLLALALVGSKATGTKGGEVQLSAESIKMLTSAISEKITSDLSKSVVLSGLTHMLNSQEDSSRETVALSSLNNEGNLKPSITNSTEGSMDDEPVIPQSIVDMKNKSKSFF